MKLPGLFSVFFGTSRQEIHGNDEKRSEFIRHFYALKPGDFPQYDCSQRSMVNAWNGEVSGRHHSLLNRAAGAANAKKDECEECMTYASSEKPPSQ